MTSDEQTLLAQIEGLAIDPPGAAQGFADRLARENGWSPGYAARVLAEYRRFLFLAATGARAVTPSDAVDQAWHLHLAYTRSYWNDLCGAILGRPLHHGPTAGGAAEARRYRAQYAATLDAYRAVFGAPPPADIWPPLRARFAGRFVRVDRRRSLVLPKALAAPLLAVPALGACGLVAANAAAPGGGGGISLALVAALVAVFAGAFVAIGAAAAQRRGAKDRKDGGCDAGTHGSHDGDSDGGGDGGGDGGSGCGGGCGS